VQSSAQQSFQELAQDMEERILLDLACNPLPLKHLSFATIGLCELVAAAKKLFFCFAQPLGQCLFIHDRLMLGHSLNAS